MKFDIENEEQTAQLARAIAKYIRAHDAILLTGPLGAGKSEIARMIIRTLTGDPKLIVPSPSFTLVQPYQTPDFEIFHFDLWRLGDEEELEELGWEDAQNGVVIVEWPQLLGQRTPQDALSVMIDLSKDLATGRHITLKGWSAERMSMLRQEYMRLKKGS